MKKAARRIYIELASEIDWNICGFCRYNRTEGSVCSEEALCECEHPLWEVSEYADNVDGPGCDCWGFSPVVNVRDCADIVGLILSSGFDPEMTMYVKKDKQIKVFGKVKERVATSV